MRLRAFEIKNVGPIKRLHVTDIADVVVFAGPNGVGKTHILQALIDCARNSRRPDTVWVQVEATCDDERTRWKRNTLDTKVAEEASIWATNLQRHQRRNRHQSSLLNFDSDRAIRNIQPYQFVWDIGNPLLENVGWDTGLTAVSNRHNEVRHSLFRMVESQKREVADRAFALKAEGKTEMALDIPDVLKTFKDAFPTLSH